MCRQGLISIMMAGEFSCCCCFACFVEEVMELG